MKNLIILIAGAFLIEGCATGYTDRGMMGGYSETRLDENVFQVSFRGNGYTSSERASDFTMLRSAELVLEHGYKYFAVIDQDSSVSNSTYTTPTTTNTNVNVFGTGNSAFGTATSTTTGGQTYNISKPSSSNTIVGFVEKPDDIFTYNAEFIFQSITDKYGINPYEE
jgi:hypothetical protein